MNQNRYDPSQIEAKWAKIWEEKRIYRVDVKSAKKPFGPSTPSTSFRTSPLRAQGKPFYNLAMFPYPSGEGLHVGHIVPYSGVDTFGRYKKMKGFDVFEPMGFDSFGIHSENYAIKQGKHPSELTNETIKYFRDKQMKRLGTLFDWSRQVITSEPDYYKWTQWIFVQMFKHGLAYKKLAPVTYCPSCKTVLSDEQTEARGGIAVCERCKTLIERKEMKQWFFKITRYAEKLLSNLLKIEWSQRTINAQREWIGKSEGILFTYKVKDLDIQFSVFDSVPQTYMAQSFTVIAPEHPRLIELVKGTEYEKPVMEFAERIKKKRVNKQYDIEKETEGIFTGRYIEYTPANRLLPIWASSFVIAEYGTGVVNASAHDERDFAFAKKYNLPLHPVMFPKDKIEAEKVKNLEYCYHHAPHGVLTEPQEFKGRQWGEVRSDIISYIEQHGWGKRTAQYHLRDWCISRQRYWGPPIPMVYCLECERKGITYFDLISHSERSEESSEAAFDAGKRKNKNVADARSFSASRRIRMTIGKEGFESMPGWFPVPEEELPVLLPETNDYLPDGSGKSPLARIPEFVHTKCPYCGSVADRETDVSDTFLDSSWYFLRYPSVETKNQEPTLLRYASEGQGTKNKTNGSKFSVQSSKLTLPWDPEVTKKWLPVDMYIGGQEHACLHLMYARFVTMALCDMGYINFEEPFTKFFAHGLMIKEGAKMSKSRGNVVNPVKYLDLYGSDTLRMYVLFMGPYDQKMDFRDSGIDGMYRFLGRVYTFVQKELSYSLSRQLTEKSHNDSSLPPLAGSNNKELLQSLHKTIKGVGEDIGKLHFNTAIAKLMEFLNEATKMEYVDIEIVKSYLKLLAPFAPFIAEELWLQINGKQTGKNWSIHQQTWPEYDEKHLQEGTVTVVAQINGKVRDSMVIPFEKTLKQEEIEKLFKEGEKVQKYLKGKKVIKTIFIPGKVVNFVVES